MDLWVLTGYVAHAALTAYWFWVVAATAPQLRRGTRNRRVRLHVLLIKTAALALTAVVVGIIHYWATAWWHLAVSLPVAVGLAVLLRRAYRRTVAAPRHRLTLSRRARARDVHRRPHRRPHSSHSPAHLRTNDVEPVVIARLAD